MLRLRLSNVNVKVKVEEGVSLGDNFRTTFSIGASFSPPANINVPSTALAKTYIK